MLCCYASLSYRVPHQGHYYITPGLELRIYLSNIPPSAIKYYFAKVGISSSEGHKPC